MDKNRDAIIIDNLCLNYKIFKKFSIRKNLLQLNSHEPNIFQALKNITFSVEKGNIVGIIGKNGSGKSTLLNAIAGIFSPDSGKIDLLGNSVSLLSIGVGFQKELSGRENIILSGMLLGFSEKYILEKIPDIIEFADLGNFIDMPVKTYSSGMHSKLSFSIAVTLETDIILIDEVLSVGDAKFRKKSYNKMKEIISDESKTVIIVSHNTASLQELCNRIIWLHDGEIYMDGEPEIVLNAYLEFMNK